MTSRVVFLAASLGLLVLGGAASSERVVEAHAVTRGETAELPVIRTPAAAAATWCGFVVQRDLAPNVVAGLPIHWLYVVPSDGSPALTTYANVMQTDAEAIDAWWRREDPTRTPRNDLVQLPCGAQLDISVVRLGSTGAELDSDFNFGDILDGIDAVGFGSAFTKYVVYYDGPVSPTAEGEVCGRGGSLPSGLGLAVVYVRACVGVSTAAVAAHEILHTLDAVPLGAPNDCDRHVCDREDDLMYPFLGESPLDAKLLDPGRNDYYGHSGPQDDAQDSDWLVRLNAQSLLRVNVSGTGSVRADVPGLGCARTCSTIWNTGTRLKLEATPSGTTKLVRWSGACSGAASCAVSVAPGRTVTALFAPRRYRLAVSVEGRGSVRSSRGGIACGTRCAAAVSSYVRVRLTATPAKGWRLRSWTGACRGRKLTCTLPMSTPATARAVFVRGPKA